ncbi:lysosome-associated membrane glycoprotein 1-like, partial [Sinocyclocheilus grahami]|uniref:lysosome-associated membrane glycoprotein 1-like n=1 Tax=Sinocyclocheilus grahami TaxID=75366 RepID=UPI0007ACCECD
ADVPPTVVAPETSSPPASPATPGPPERGSYNVTNATDAGCLLARMGLQLNISFISSSHGKTVQEVLNLHPNLVKFSGSCDPDSATLILTEDNITLTFSFSLNSTSNKYHLSGLELSAALPDMASKSFFSPPSPFLSSCSVSVLAEECDLDEDDMLIPIIVGAALAVLVLIVILAYLIGRKRSHAGYQTI